MGNSKEVEERREVKVVERNEGQEKMEVEEE